MIRVGIGPLTLSKRVTSDFKLFGGDRLYCHRQGTFVGREIATCQEIGMVRKPPTAVETSVCKRGDCLYRNNLTRGIGDYRSVTEKPVAEDHLCIWDISLKGNLNKYLVGFKEQDN